MHGWRHQDATRPIFEYEQALCRRIYCSHGEAEVQVGRNKENVSAHPIRLDEREYLAWYLAGAE